MLCCPSHVQADILASQLASMVSGRDNKATLVVYMWAIYCFVVVHDKQQHRTLQNQGEA